MSRPGALAGLLLAAAAGCREEVPDRPLVGVVLPLTGAHARLGTAARVGLAALIEQVVEPPCAFEFRDTGSDPVKAARQVLELAGLGASLVISACEPASEAVAVAEAERLGVPVVAALGDQDDLVTGKPFAFRIGSRARTQAWLLEAAAWPRLAGAGRPAVLVLTDLDDPAALDRRDRFEQLLAERHPPHDQVLLDRAYYRSSRLDLSEVESRFQAFRPDLVVILGDHRVLRPLLERVGSGLKEAALWVGAFRLGPDELELPTLPSGKSLHLIVAADFDPGVSSAADAFTRLFRRRFQGRAPSAATALGHDAGRVAVAALEASSAPSERHSVQQALQGLRLHDLATVSAPHGPSQGRPESTRTFGFDDNGNAVEWGPDGRQRPKRPCLQEWILEGDGLRRQALALEAGEEPDDREPTADR